MNKRPLPCVLAGFVLGEVWIYQFGETAAVAAFCLAVIVGGILLWKRQDGSFFAFLFCAFGCFFGLIRQYQWNQELIAFSSLYEKESCVLEGQIEESKEQETGTILVLNHIKVEEKNYGGKVQVYLEQKPVFVIGSRMRVTGSVEAFSEPTNPGEFNQKKYQEGRGVFGSIYHPEVEKVYYGSFLMKDAILKFRKKTSAFLEATMGKEQYGVATAMLLGDRSALLEEQKNLFEMGGISHILAVSGLHMTLIGAGIYKIFRKIGFPYGAAVFASFPCIAIYSTMTGAGSSCLRAAAMLCVYLVAEWKGYSYDLPSSLALSGILLLWEIPARLYDSGFLLSYSAMLAIGILYPLFMEWMNLVKQGERNRIEKIRDSFLSSLILLAVMLPLSLYYFYGFSLAGLFLNLLVIPIMSLLVPVLAFGGVGWISWCPGVWGRFFLGIAEKIIDFYLFLCKTAEKIPFSYLRTGYRGTLFALIYYVGLGVVFFILWRMSGSYKMRQREVFSRNDEERQRSGLPGNIGKRRFLLFIWLLFSFGLILVTGKKGAFLTLLDVGQGDGIFYYSREGKVCMIDGGSSSKKQVGTYVIQSALKYYGCSGVDYWFLTHFDEDHTSGLEELLEKGYSISNLILPDWKQEEEKRAYIINLAKENGTKVLFMSRGQQISLGEERLYCVHPAKDAKGEDGNQDSLVLLLETAHQEILLTGDVEKDGEKEMTRYLSAYLKKEADKSQKEQQTKGEENQLGKQCLLKVAHHGSKNASSAAFLNIFSPETAIVSAGKNNRYGHPAVETVERIEESGAVLYNTANLGAIELKLGETIGYYHYG